MDLLLNPPDPLVATRVLVDLKSGRAWPDHPEDMRLYALLYTLRYGVPPYRVATLFLGSTQPGISRPIGFTSDFCSTSSLRRRMAGVGCSNAPTTSSHSMR